MDFPEILESRLAALPAKPGCYMMRDAERNVIYVGKAINLRSRVRSYFHNSVDSFKTLELMKRVADVEWIVVASELEALILEMTLIKQHRPKYNVRLKDDKRYPYIKVHTADPFPTVTVTRRMETDGSKYFGPYTSAWAVHETLDVLRRIFPYLTCDRVITGTDPRACLYHDIKLCMAPCIGASSQAEYRGMIDDLCAFLQGRTQPVIGRLKADMQAASDATQYEKAAAIRDRLTAIDKVVERQKVVSNEQTDSDVIAFARDAERGDACVQVFFIRAGKLIGREYFVLEGTQGEASADIVAGFVKQFYDEAAYVPGEVLLPEQVEEAMIIEQWLRSKRGSAVHLRVPRHGQPHELVQMAAENAAETLNALRAQWDSDRAKQGQAVAALQAALGLPMPPGRIECFDVSNLQGTAVTASMVVFEQGVPRKSDYRRFTVKTVKGQDDFASLREVLERRLRRWQAATGQARAGVVASADAALPDVPDPAKQHASWARLPDLLIVDGGKGQLNAAVDVLREFELLGRLPLIGLAKQHEEIYLLDRPDAVILPRGSPELFLVQRVRDEAHRFAVEHHRSRRTRLGLASQLDSIPGIGPARRKALLRSFGDLNAIRRASLEQLLAVPGITRGVAQALKDQL